MRRFLPGIPLAFALLALWRAESDSSPFDVLVLYGRPYILTLVAIGQHE